MRRLTDTGGDARSSPQILAIDHVERVRAAMATAGNGHHDSPFEFEIGSRSWNARATVRDSCRNRRASAWFPDVHRRRTRRNIGAGWALPAGRETTYAYFDGLFCRSWNRYRCDRRRCWRRSSDRGHDQSQIPQAGTDPAGAAHAAGADPGRGGAVGTRAISGGCGAPAICTQSRRCGGPSTEPGEHASRQFRVDTRGAG
jgi:hypothetical protein